MVQQTITTGDSTGTVTTSGCSCSHMLPCGVCRILMINCPKQDFTITPTWKTPDITCINYATSQTGTQQLKKESLNAD